MVRLLLVALRSALSALQTHRQLALENPVLRQQLSALQRSGRRPRLSNFSAVGSVGDSYDNALAESIIGLFKTEVIWQRRSWRGLREVEMATLAWVDWFNHRRLLGPIGDVPPAEHEAAHQLRHETLAAVAGVN